jgi:hypothetical protein
MDKRQEQPKIVFDVDNDTPEEAYQKVRAKAVRDFLKPSTHPDTWKEYKENYWPVTTSEYSDASDAFSVYGSPPFYHIVIKHKDATPGASKYDWHVSPSSGVIITRDIKKDPNLKEKELPLSEILFHLLTKEVPCVERTLGAKPSPPFKLTRLIQYNVASGYTFKVLKQIGIPQDEETQTVCQSGTDHFLALLGTVNFNSVIYLLKDHGEALGLKGVGNLTVLKVKNPGKAITGVIVDFH